MQIPIQDQYRLQDKVRLTLKVNYISSVLSIVFGIVCIYMLKITQIIPATFIAYGVLNLANTVLFRKHKTLVITYNFTTIIALTASVIITIYSGGINSPFIFVLALVVFAGYITTKVYGRVYLNFNLIIIILIYSQSISELSFTENVVPVESKNLFALFSILFSVYLLGGVIGKNLLKAHNELHKIRNENEARIKEKDTLLKEIHHRVKNNLQTVSSLLSLQSRSIREPEIKTLIKSSQNRVISMAMVHEMLYMRHDLSKIEYKSYVEELSDYLLRSFKGADNNITLNIKIPDVKLGIDTAIPLGLLINEVITNALKYGIKDNDAGEIHIELLKCNSRDFILNIGDDGEGFPESISHKNTKSLGLKLIYNLARQLKGSINRDSSKKGTNYIVKFSDIQHTFKT